MKVLRKFKQDIYINKINWLGLLLAVPSGIIGVHYGFNGNVSVAGICAVIYILGLYFVSRPYKDILSIPLSWRVK